MKTHLASLILVLKQTTMSVSNAALLVIMVLTFATMIFVMIMIGYFLAPFWPLLLQARKRNQVKHYLQRKLLIRENTCNQMISSGECSDPALDGDLEEQSFELSNSSNITNHYTYDETSRIALNSYPMDSARVLDFFIAAFDAPENTTTRMATNAGLTVQPIQLSSNLREHISKRLSLVSNTAMSYTTLEYESAMGSSSSGV